MSGDGLNRSYEKLGVDERLRLVIEARARGDGDDEATLIDACPVRAVEMRDIGFVLRMATAERMVWNLVADVAPSFGWLDLATQLGEADGAAGDEGGAVPSCAHSGSLAEAPAEAMRLIATRWLVFGSSCREELGMEPETVLRAFWASALDYLCAPTLPPVCAIEDDDRYGEARREWRERDRTLWLAVTEGE